MKFLFLLTLTALLVCKALCQWNWDPANILLLRADDNFFQAYDLRGNDVMCVLTSSDLGAGRQLRDTRVPPRAESIWAADKFSRKRDRWYWFEQKPLDHALNFGLQGWGEALTDIGAHPGQAAWRSARYTHNDPSSTKFVQDQTYLTALEHSKYRYRRATGGMINIASYQPTAVAPGIVIFQPSLPVRAAARRNWGPNIDEDELPVLSQPSDFLYHQWTFNLKGPKSRNLAFCGQQQVNDLSTNKLIARALLSRGLYDLEDWPATHSLFTTDTSEGRAILASPAAQGCARFLYEHKRTLGLKYIPAIRVFQGPSTYTPLGPKRLPQLLFEVADVPDNMVKADPPPDWVPPPPQVVPRPTPLEGIPGPSTPRPVSGRQVDRELPSPRYLYDVRHEGSGRNIVRVHTFSMA